MTTIACNLKEMAADTRVTWEGIGTDQFTSIKLYPANGALYGITGENCTGALHAVEWLQKGASTLERPIPPEYEHDWEWKIIELGKNGIGIYNIHLERESALEPFLAVGSGRKVAMYCMKYLGMSPAQAVHEACKVDMWSEAPIYSASLRDTIPRRWTPPKSKTVRRQTDSKTLVQRKPA